MRELGRINAYQGRSTYRTIVVTDGKLIRVLSPSMLLSSLARQLSDPASKANANGSLISTMRLIAQVIRRLRNNYKNINDGTYFPSGKVLFNEITPKLFEKQTIVLSWN